MYKNRGYKSLGTALIGEGTAVLMVLLLTLKQYFRTGDFLSLIVLLLLSVGPITAGVLIIRWARKNGKE